jgi:hypothetical protein
MIIIEMIMMGVFATFFMASKSSNKGLIIRTNFINHTNFGLGLLIWILSFHRFFI